MTTQNGSGVEHLQDKVRNLVDSAAERAESIKTRAIDAKDDVMSRGNALIERITDMITTNPLKAVGVAFAAGYFGMRLVRR